MHTIIGRGRGVTQNKATFIWDRRTFVHSLYKSFNSKIVANFTACAPKHTMKTVRKCDGGPATQTRHRKGNEIGQQVGSGEPEGLA